MKKEPNFQKKTIPVVTLLAMVLLVFSMVSCGGGQKLTHKEQSKNYHDLVELIQSKNFEIENMWALPLRGGQINLIGNTNYLKVMGDSVALFLPYFGVRHSGGTYGGEGGINFEGKLRDFKIKSDSIKQKVRVHFEARQNSENLTFYIQVFPNKSSTISVNSSERDAISYRGTLEKMTKKDTVQ